MTSSGKQSQASIQTLRSVFENLWAFRPVFLHIWVDFVCRVQPTREWKLRGVQEDLRVFLKIGGFSVLFVNIFYNRFCLQSTAHGTFDLTPLWLLSLVGHGGREAEGKWII